MMFSGVNGAGSLAVNSTAQYFSIPGMARNTTEIRSQSAMAFGGTLSNLVFTLRNIDTDGAFQSTTNTGVVVVTNGVASSLYAILNGNGAITITNSGTRAVVVGQYDKISLLITNSIAAGSVAGSYLAGSIGIYP